MVYAIARKRPLAVGPIQRLSRLAAIRRHLMYRIAENLFDLLGCDTVCRDMALVRIVPFKLKRTSQMYMQYIALLYIRTVNTKKSAL